MPLNPESALLKNLLDEYDALSDLRRRQREERLGTSRRNRVRLEARRKLDAIARAVRQLDPSGSLGTFLKRYRFNKFQVVMILALLKRRLTHEQGSLKGRELLSLVGDTSFEILKAVSLLDPASALLSSGVVVPDATAAEESDDVLDASFFLSERAYRLILATFSKNVDAERPPLPTKEAAYRSNLAYLMDLRRLCLLYQKRAAKVFNFDYWDHLGLGISESVTSLNKQIAKYTERIKASLLKTKDAEKLALISFAREYGLELEEVLILVTLLFQELIEGNSYLDAVDLLKLVARNEEDLVKRRKLFGPRSALIRHNLVLLEEMVQEKPLTAEVTMPAWVAEKLLAGTQTGKIDADSRIQFHKYLNRLDSSESFFEDLESQN